MRMQGDRRGPPRPGPAQTWKPLQVLNLYRLALALLFSGLGLGGLGPRFLGEQFPELFNWTSVAYLVFALGSALTISRRRPGFGTQVYLQVAADVAAVTIFMHASGGATSGLGMLLLVTIAGASLLMPGRHAFLFAATASLAILAEQFYAHLLHVFPTTAYTQAGMLGAAFFAAAVLADALSRQARESETVAAQRGVDLANMEKLNAQIIQYMQSGIVVVDADERVVLMNNAAWYLLGLPARVEGQRMVQVSTQLSQQLREWQADRGREPHSFRNQLTGPDLLPSFTALGSDARAGVLVLLEDASLLAQQAQQMKLASLGRLTASIAHEIRNPLGAISHAAQLLAEGEGLGTADQRLVEIIGTQSQRMNTIIENVLQLSRRSNARPEVVPLGPWLTHFCSEFAHQQGLDAEQLALTVTPADTEVWIDPSQLHQILTNLCENAQRYGKDPASGRLQLTLTGGITRESRVPFLEIVDNGPGIEPELTGQIFEPFFTTDSGGTGLGLFIAKELCECNLAQLDYVPIPTGGSCFRLVFADPKRHAA